MVTNDLGACEWFVWDLRRSGLIDRGQLDQIVSEFLKRNPRAEAPALAEYLVQHDTLSAFQAERILNGKTQGLVLGPYVLMDAIGQGSMGQVYKGSSKNDANIYAVKVLPRRSMWNVRLARRQVRSFSQFSHPAVVPFVDVGTAGGLHYLVWPMVEGQTLETLIQQTGKLSVAQTATIGMQVAQGLAIAHQNSLFHGLVKPSNIMLGSDQQVRILDFGIGSLLVENEGESLVDTMSTANTLTSGLDCASPESILEPSNRTPAGDQYSLGCILYNCLTGHPPFPEGSAVEKMMAHQTKDPTPIKEYDAEVPDAIIEVVHRLMAKKPEDRFSGCDEVIEALEPYIGGFGDNGGGYSEPNRPSSIRPGSFGARPTTTASGMRPSMGTGSGERQGLPQDGSYANARSGIAARAASAPGTQTPPPAVGMPIGPPQIARPGFSSAAARASSAGNSMGMGIPIGNPVPVRSSSFPSRASFQTSDQEVPLTPANAAAYQSMTPELPAYNDPNRGSVPGGWLPMDQDSKKPAFGTIGVVCATVLLMVLVYFGAQFLMNK